MAAIVKLAYELLGVDAMMPVLRESSPGVYPDGNKLNTNMTKANQMLRAIVHCMIGCDPGKQSSSFRKIELLAVLHYLGVTADNGMTVAQMTSMMIVSEHSFSMGPSDTPTGSRIGGVPVDAPGSAVPRNTNPWTKAVSDLTFFGVFELPKAMPGVPSWLDTCDRVVVWVLMDEAEEEGKLEMSCNFWARLSFIKAGQDLEEISADTVLETPEHLGRPERKTAKFQSEIYEPYRRIYSESEDDEPESDEEEYDGRSETQKLVDSFKAGSIGFKKPDPEITDKFEHISTMPVMDDDARVIFQGPISTCQQTKLVSPYDFRIQIPFLHPDIVKSDAPMALFTAKLPKDMPVGPIRAHGGWDCC